MPKFRVKACDHKGVMTSRVMEAADETKAIAQLQGIGLIPVEISLTKGDGFLQGIVRKGAFKRQDLLMVTRSLVNALEAGMPLEQALKLVMASISKTSQHEVLENILEQIQAGGSFADALIDADIHFPVFYASMVRAGEAGGSLREVLTEIAKRLEQSDILVQQVRSALIYPAFLMVMIGLTISVLLTFVVPQFEPLFASAGAALPTSTQIVVDLGRGFSSYWHVILLSLLAIILTSRFLYQRPSVKLLVDRIIWNSFLGLVSRYEISQFCRVFGLLVHNSVSLPRAIAVAKKMAGNKAFLDALEQVEDKMREGAGLSGPLAESHIMPDLALQMIRVGEETGQLNNMLDMVATLYEREVSQTLQRFVALLVPVLTVFMGGVIALLIGAIIVGILSVNQLAI